MLCSRRRKKSRRTHINIDDKVKQPLNTPNPQQHTHDTSDQSQHDHTDSSTVQLGAEVSLDLDWRQLMHCMYQLK